MKINKKVLNGVLGAGVLGVVLIGGAFAYLTDIVDATITVTIGDVEVELDQDNALDGTEYVIPNEELLVKPYITNTGTNDAVVFMEVIIPIIDDAYIVKLSGMAQTDTTKIVELFTIAYGTNLDTANWAAVETRVYDLNDEYMGSDVTATDATTVGYVYGYKAKIGTDEATVDKTTALFQYIKAANFTEEYDKSQNTPVDIPVKVYAIQAEYVNGSQTQATSATDDPNTNAIDTTGALDSNALTAIFNTFVNQNNLNGI